MERRRWTRKWSASWRNRLWRRWRIENDKFADVWYNRNNQFIQRAHKYEDLDELTPYALRELVKAIYIIEAPDRSGGKRRRNIRISYDLVGFIPAEELLRQETA